MKKILFAAILFATLLGTKSVSAQEMRWGVTAGLTVTNQKWSQDQFRQEPFDSDKSLGYAGGIIGEYEIPGIGFGIDIGLQYVQRGSSMNLGDFAVWADDDFGRERAYLHYLDVPFHLRFKYMNLNGFERKLAPFAFAGPNMSILLAHNDLNAFNYKSVQLGIEVGIGVEIYRDFQLSGSFNWDVTGTARAVKLDNFNSHNRTWHIALTYFFK